MNRLQVLEVQKFMMDIIDEHPLCAEYETDARDIWPKRWESLRKKLLESASQPTVAPDTNKTEPCKWCGYPHGYWAGKRTIHCQHD